MKTRFMLRLTGIFVISGSTSAIVGCGGPDLFGGNSSTGSGFNSGLGGNYGGGYGGNYGGGSYGGNYGGGANGARQAGGVRGRGTYPKIEASFELGDVKGNPFDYTENDVVVTINTQDGRSIKVPAFFDGGKTWRMRYSPDSAGRHTISNVTLNGKPAQTDKLDKKEFDASGTPTAGFVRRDSRDKTRFVLDNGNNYYPIGHNQPFESGKSSEIIGRLDKMGKAGENWTRVWMSHFDGKSLDWPEKGKAEIGKLDLEAAKRWDEIVDASEKDGIRIQIVLQHHGQYSTRVDPAWDQNPWNKKNGGWMSTPDEFFSNTRAVALTKAKYRYILARWGYSTSIMAWELFNEVENTDSSAHKHQDEIATWHSGMAAFIRQNDPYKHLITTSADLQDTALWQNMDFFQAHTYPSESTVAAALDSRKYDKPIFYGEFGPSGVKEGDYSSWLHRALWAGIMSGAAGAPQPWQWDWIEKNDLYGQMKSVSDFIRTSGYSGRHNLLPAAVSVEMKERGPLTFGPGAGWAASKQTEFTVSASGTIDGLAQMPSFLQGSAHKDMFSAESFKVNYPEAGSFKVRLAKVAQGGAHVVLSVDGATAAEKDFPAAPKDTEVETVLEAKVGAGSHLVKLDNTGPDWVAIRSLVLDPYAPSHQVYGRASKDYAALWIANNGAKESSGKIALSGMQAGSYKVTWWDTSAGKTLSEDSATVASSGPLTLTTPAIAKDMAVYITRSGEKSASKVSTPKKAKGAV